MSVNNTTVPNTEQDYILLLGIVCYIGNIILLGLTTKNSAHLGLHFLDLGFNVSCVVQ